MGTVALEVLNNIFSFIFLCELVFKLIGNGPERYWRNPWNKFDAFIVFVSIVGVFFDYIYTSDAINPTFIRVLRVFRVARIMKLIKSAKGLQALLDTVFKSLGQVASIAMLLMLFFFIYACAAVTMFGRLSYDSDDNEGIDKHAHFRNWPMAMLTLFRICTGDNGSGILIDALRTSPDCDADEDCTRDCCASAPLPFIVTPLYFMTFTIMAQFIMLNVVVAVLMAQLEEAQEALGLGRPKPEGLLFEAEERDDVKEEAKEGLDGEGALPDISTTKLEEAIPLPLETPKGNGGEEVSEQAVVGPSQPGEVGDTSGAHSGSETKGAGGGFVWSPWSPLRVAADNVILNLRQGISGAISAAQHRGRERVRDKERYREWLESNARATRRGPGQRAASVL